MNEEEILAMEAGKTLDCIILVEVFDKAVTRIEDVLNYSTDISAAWQVLEKTDFDAIWRIINPDKVQYAVGFACGVHGDLIRYIKGGNLEEYFSPICDTFPEAICKAALLAVLCGEVIK